MRKKLLIVIAAVFAVLLSTSNLQAFSAKEHNDYLERVLFGNYSSYKNNSETKKIIESLENASYLAIDQNGRKTPGDQNKLDDLKDRGVKVPKLDDLLFSISGGGFEEHRRYTHKGWNFEYKPEDKAHWKSIRKKLLMDTVNKELSFGFFSNFLWFDYDQKCKDFSALIYYVHVLGDFIADDYETKNDALNNMMHLADERDPDNSLLSELSNHLKSLFADEKGDYNYRELIDGLKELEHRAASVYHTPGNLNTKEKYDEYHDCAEAAMELLIERVPELLKKESFFKNTFYK